MPYLNQVTIAGHLGRDAEVRFTKAGKPWASFSVAVTEKYKTDEGWKETTTWIGCKWWGCYEDAGKWLVKGTGVFVVGKLANNSWEDKDGNKRSQLEVKVDTGAQLAKHEKRQASAAPAAASGSPNWDDLSEEPPF